MPRRALQVEGGEGLGAGVHVLEAPHPDETIGIVQVAELPDDVDADGLLALDELAVEQFDELVPPAGWSVYCRSSTAGQQPPDPGS
jgi:hypothetical protein